MALHLVTPVLESAPLARASGVPTRVKVESLQPSGSFKIRGIGRACEEAKAAGARSLVSSSGGNAGLAVAWAGRVLGVPVRVVVPRTTSTRMVGKMRDEGATVQVHGDAWDDAHAEALRVVESDGGFYVHPFDAPAVWSGNATIITELPAQGVPRPGAVVVSVGGGGLLCGVLEGMHALGWTDVPVLAVETHGAASLHAAMKAGQPVDIGRIDSNRDHAGRAARVRPGPAMDPRAPGHLVALLGPAGGGRVPALRRRSPARRGASVRCGARGGLRACARPGRRVVAARHRVRRGRRDARGPDALGRQRPARLAA